MDLRAWNLLKTTLQTELSGQGPEIVAHARRVQKLVLGYSHVMGFTQSFTEVLSTGALLHDIGKVAVPEQILSKPGSLDPAEWAIVKRHPEIGYRMVSAYPYNDQISDTVLSHHERWDGNGYPHGLAGEAIPDAARIIAVADAFDAITHDRPYRKARPPLVALSELQSCAESQFDPEVVHTFCQYITALCSSLQT